MGKNSGDKVRSERNWVAKNDFNVGGAHEDKRAYKRKPKHPGRRGESMGE